MSGYHKSLFALIAGLFLLPCVPLTWAQDLPALAKQLKPEETAIIFVDFQNNFAAPDGEHYPRYKKIFDETKMLENSVDLVKKARVLGVQVIQVTEGYTADYRELDWSNPGAFHRSQILRQSWKMGTKPVELYEPLRPGPSDKDILLPNRMTVSGFVGNSLDYILKSRGIKNVALGGFSTEGCVYATLLSAYDLGYHVYALKDAMASNRIQLSELLLQESYPKYSRVMGYKEFLQMLEGFKTAKK
ncbi:cysteine hydrolase family protein [bacterium]|nr:MAG: cysteine hydrolase family protein [bacterium]